MAVEDSYVFRTLEFLATTQGRTRTEDVWADLTAWQARGGLRQDGLFWRSIPESEEKMATALERLKDVRVVLANKDDKQWELVSGRNEREEVNVIAEDEGPFDGGRGDGGDGGGDNGAGGQEGGGGAGLSEVLSHPVLFCMSEADQNNLIEAALGLPSEGAQA